jgi:uncharacterized protein
MISNAFNSTGTPHDRQGAAVDVLVVLVLVFASTVVGALIASLWPVPEIPAAIAIQGIMMLASVRFLLGRRDGRARDIGLVVPRPRDVIRALLILMTCYATTTLALMPLSVFAPDAMQGHMDTTRLLGLRLTEGMPWTMTGLLMLFVVFYEEVVARGFLLARCRLLLHTRWAAVLLSSLLFGLAHLYQGWGGALLTAIVGAVFAGFTLRWGTLWPAILAHAGLNLSTLVALDHLADL